MGPSGRAGSPVKKDMSGREGHGHRGRECQSSRRSVTMLSTCCRSNSVRHMVHPPSVHDARARERNTCVFKGVPRRVRIQRAREWTSSPQAGQAVREPSSNTAGTIRQEMPWFPEHVSVNEFPARLSAASSAVASLLYFKTSPCRVWKISSAKRC